MFVGFCCEPQPVQTKAHCAIWILLSWCRSVVILDNVLIRCFATIDAVLLQVILWMHEHWLESALKWAIIYSFGFTNMLLLTCLFNDLSLLPMIVCTRVRFFFGWLVIFSRCLHVDFYCCTFVQRIHSNAALFGLYSFPILTLNLLSNLASV